MTTNRSPLFCLMIWTLVLASVAREELSAAQEVPSVQITLSVPKQTFSLGESIPISVKLTNSSGSGVLIGRYLANFKNAPSKLEIEVEDTSGQISRGSYGYIEMSPELTRAWWLDLPPNHFFGLETRLDTASYPLLNTAGRRCITALYVSSGGEGGSLSQRARKPKDNAHRPKIWTGQVKSNPVCIDIIASSSPKS